MATYFKSTDNRIIRIKADNTADILNIADIELEISTAAAAAAGLLKQKEDAITQCEWEAIEKTATAEAYAKALKECQNAEAKAKAADEHKAVISEQTAKAQEATEKLLQEYAGIITTQYTGNIRDIITTGGKSLPGTIEAVALAGQVLDAAKNEPTNPIPAATRQATAEAAALEAAPVAVKPAAVPVQKAATQFIYDDGIVPPKAVVGARQGENKTGDTLVKQELKNSKGENITYFVKRSQIK